MTDTDPIIVVVFLFKLGVLLSKWLAMTTLIDPSKLIIENFIIIII